MDIDVVLSEMRSGKYRANLYAALDRLVQGKSRELIDAREDTTVADLMLRVAEDIAGGWAGTDEGIANGRDD